MLRAKALVRAPATGATSWTWPRSREGLLVDRVCEVAGRIGRSAVVTAEGGRRGRSWLRCSHADRFPVPDDADVAAPAAMGEGEATPPRPCAGLSEGSGRARICSHEGRPCHRLPPAAPRA